MVEYLKHHNIIHNSHNIGKNMKGSNLRYVNPVSSTSLPPPPFVVLSHHHRSLLKNYFNISADGSSGNLNWTGVGDYGNRLGTLFLSKMFGRQKRPLAMLLIYRFPFRSLNWKSKLKLDPCYIWAGDPHAAGCANGCGWIIWRCVWDNESPLVTLSAHFSLAVSETVLGYQNVVNSDPAGVWVQLSSGQHRQPLRSRTWIFLGGKAYFFKRFIWYFSRGNSRFKAFGVSVADRPKAKNRCWSMTTSSNCAR
jgi:hypothetical protein